MDGLNGEERRKRTLTEQDIEAIQKAVHKCPFTKEHMENLIELAGAWGTFKQTGVKFIAKSIWTLFVTFFVAGVGTVIYNFIQGSKGP